MSKIASLNPSDTLDTVTKFHRVMDKAGVPWERFQLAINNRTARRNLAEYLNMGCPRVKDSKIVEAPTDDYDIARRILGKDFISPEEIAKARNLTYSDDVLNHLAETLPPEEILQWCRDNNFVLIAGPPNQMSLLEIRDLNPHLFYSKESGWYEGDRERFSREDKVTAEWLMLRKEVVPNSKSKNWDEQRNLISEAEYVPNVPELAWGTTIYKEVHDVWLLPSIYARTSSVDSDGGRVGLGDSADGGVYVDYYWDDNRIDILGLASARKRNLKS